ncbi:hypothetical protein RB594_007242 [Gaeumannomyces avenae]
MVNAPWLGGLAARAALFASARLETRAETRATYSQRTSDAAGAVQAWYKQGTGQWETGWWNSANVLTTLADFVMIDSASTAKHNLAALASNTFTQAQKPIAAAAPAVANNAVTNSAISTQEIAAAESGEIGSMIMSKYEALEASMPGRARLGGKKLMRRQSQGNAGFLNHFYDDEGWWALAWIRAFDVFKDRRYLDMAEDIFTDMEKGVDDVCGGGIWWNKDRKYKNAITNQLYFSVAASLANRDVKRRRPVAYRDIAVKQWAWLQGSGMQNADGLFNDGLNINADGTCTNNKQQTWTYNQGVVLGGLVELHALTGQQDMLDKAFRIAEAAVSKMVDADGILKESCEPNGCGQDGAQFKGIFVRNLRTLWLASPSRPPLRDFMLKQADSIWSRDRVEASNRLGLVWHGPANVPKDPVADTHSSAMDALVAAIAVV